MCVCGHGQAIYRGRGCCSRVRLVFPASSIRHHPAGCDWLGQSPGGGLVCSPSTFLAMGSIRHCQFGISASRTMIGKLSQ